METAEWFMERHEWLMRLHDGLNNCIKVQITLILEGFNNFSSFFNHSSGLKRPLPKKLNLAGFK